MRFAVISDIHGNLAATEAVLADIDALETPVDVIVCAGDIVGHSAHPNEVIDLLRERKIDAVRGNYDEVIAGSRRTAGTDYATANDEALDQKAVAWTQQELTNENLQYLRGLAKEARIHVSPSGRTAVTPKKTDEKTSELRKNYLVGALFGGLAVQSRRPRTIHASRVLLVHGSPRDTVEYLYPGAGRSIFEAIARDAEADVIIHGHTHQSSQQVVGGVAFIGVGSVGGSRSTEVAEYAVVEIAGPEIEVEFKPVPYDVAREARDIANSGLPSELADRLQGTASTGA